MSRPKNVNTVQIGEKIPDLELPATHGLFRLSEHRGEKVVLYFYPRDATPGCTLQGHEFTKLQAKFKKKNTIVFGVSRDDLKSHLKFKEKECYTRTPE